MKRICFVISGLTCAVLVTAFAQEPAATPPAPATAQEVVARVNDREIKRNELNAALQGMVMQMNQQGRSIRPDQAAAFERDVLEELVGRELMLQEGRQRTVADLDAKVKQETDRVTAQIGGEEQLTKALADAGVTRDDYALRVRENLIVQDTLRAIVEENSKVSDEEIQPFYDANKDKFKQPPTVRASHILLRVPPQAGDDAKAAKRAQIEALQARLKNGEDFAALAKEFSEDPGSKERGGDLGFFAQGRMVPEFDLVAFALKTNEVSDIVTTQFGFHILKVTDQQPAKDLNFDEVKENIAQGLKRRKSSEAVNKHVAELRKTAKVEILLPAPPPAAAPAAPVTSEPAKAP